MKENSSKHTQRNRKVVGLSIISIIAIMHVFSIGTYLNGSLKSLYYSYFSDLIIPIGIYFLLCIAEYKILIFQRWYIKAAIITGLATIAEVLQFFGIYALGKTFDPVDISMYVSGVVIAVIIDRLIFKQIIPYWDLKK